jgi:signal transduction histidine kinase
VLGHAQVLARDGRLTGDQRDQIAVILRSGEHLLELIDDVLEMSKIEAGYREVAREPFDLRAAASDLARSFRSRAETAGLSFHFARDPRVPDRALGDERKLRQILASLIGNAVKFTRQGSVTVRMTVAAGAGESERLVTLVTDTGPGIAEDDLARLFHPFAQATVGLEARGGTGLGLALSRDLARLMGGDVTVQSRRGAGSTFRVDLPLTRAAEPPGDEAVPPSAPDAKQATPGERVRAEDVAALPGEVRADLRAALRIADHERLVALSRGLGPEHAAVAGALDRLLQDFAYDEIDALLVE